MSNLLLETGVKAKKSARVLASLSSVERNNVLLAIADLLEKNKDMIVAENLKDLENAKANGLTDAMVDRLMLNPQRINDIAGAVRDTAELADPINVVLEGRTLPNGLKLEKKSVPLGVVGIIYESRPNVTVDCAVLCLKSGNATILRGGSEAINSNKAFAVVIRKALEQLGLPEDSVQLIENTDRKYANALMELTGYVDVLIPRGGKSLIRSVVENAKVPVIETGAGVTHIFVDETADLDMAVKIVTNAKLQRPSVCNALETLLVHNNIAEAFLTKVMEPLSKVEIHACRKSLKYFNNNVVEATEESWYTEYNDYIMNVKVVDDINESMDHIDKYSTGHSEAIVTENYDNAEMFLNTVNSSAVYVNASTRFTDGGEFGLGAEIGIATQKLHVRGPMGLMALTSTKYTIRGNGQIR